MLEEHSNMFAIMNDAILLSSARSRGALAAGMLAVSLVMGCSGERAGAVEAGPAEAPAPAADLPAVLATVDGEPITLEDVRAETADDLTKMESSYLRARNRLVSSTLTRMIQERLIR